MRNTGPRRRARERARKEPGPRRPPRRRTRRPFGATLGRWSGRERLRALGSEGRGSHRALGGGGRDYRRGRGRSSRRSDPGAVNGTRPITERGEEDIPGQAARTVGPQAAAILARSMGPKPITERGGERIQASRRGRSGRGGHGRGWSVQADHGGGRVGPGRSRPGESVRADHGGGRGARAGPGRGGRGAPCAGEPAQESLLGEERGEGGNRTRAARRVNARGWGRGGMREGMEGLRKFWVRRVSNEQTCNLHFGRIVTSGVHSRLATAGRVQGVGGSVTFTPHPPPAKIGEWPR